jgi:hypothetical protein
MQKRLHIFRCGCKGSCSNTKQEQYSHKDEIQEEDRLSTVKEQQEDDQETGSVELFCLLTEQNQQLDLTPI